MFLLCSSLYATGVRQNNGGILVVVVHAVDHNTIKHATVQVFLLYIEVRARNAVIENTFGNLHLRVLLLHRDE